MAGLGAGSLWAGSIADRRPARTLVWFAWAECVIGVWAWLTVVLIGRLVAPLSAALASGDPLPMLATPWRVLLAVLPLAIPTFLMGATLPLLARWAVDNGRLAPRAIGALYTLNTLGGAAGALLAAFWVVQWWGLSGAVLASGSIEIACGAIAWQLSARKGRSDSVRPDVSIKQPPRLVSAVAPRLLGFTTLAYFTSGFVGLALEVSVFRILQVLLGSSVYALAAMLAAFLIGIGLGSWGGALIASRFKRPSAFVALSLGALALGAGLSLRLLELYGRTGVARLPAWLPIPKALSYGNEFTFCVLVLLPATIALGAIVPAVARVASTTPTQVAGRFGRAYALNTLGAVLGAALGGLVLIPLLGTAGTVQWLTVLALLVGVSVVLLADRPAKLDRNILLATVACGVIGILLASGVDPARAAFQSRFSGTESKILEFREGPVQTIAVVHEDNPEQLDFLRLVTNQTSLTGTHLYAQRYMGLLGHLPVMYSAAPQRALVICLGTGMTGSAVIAHEQVRHLDVVEISPEVADVDPLFRAANRGLLSDPRVTLAIEDGRHALLAARDSYGVITLEPPPPRDAGVVSLYSRDFYQLSLRRLTPGGVVAQWIPLHSQSLDEVRMLVRTFAESFPYALGVLAVERDLILLGSDRPLTPSLTALQRAWQSPQSAEALTRIGFEDAAALLATVRLDRDALLGFAGAVPVVTDDDPSVEHFAVFGRRPPLPEIAALLAAPLPLTKLITEPVPPEVAARFDLARRALDASIQGALLAERRRPAQEWSQRFDLALSLRPSDSYLRYVDGASDEHLRRLQTKADADNNADAWLAIAQKRELRGEPRETQAALRRAMELAPNDPRALLSLGKWLIDSRTNLSEGRALLTRALALLPPDHRLAEPLRRMLSSGPAD
ncbi:MAG: fused MFS/spermidine synthase [Acidobacteriota bacterium]